MRRWLLCLVLSGCGSGFEVPARPDMRVSLDLASTTVGFQRDMSCINTACGGCSSWLKFDGTPAKEGDPCLFKGALSCMGTELICSDVGCPSCPGAMTGSVCGADGHTILELLPQNGCTAYDFGSAIDVCNHSADDQCVGRCTKNGSGYACTAHCISDDAGATGCAHQPTDTCQSLSSC